MATTATRKKARATAKRQETEQAQFEALANPDVALRSAAASHAALSRTAKLKEIRLPAGDVGSISVGWYPGGYSMVFDPAQWKREGYEGARFIGQGPDRTHLRCTSSDGTTFAVIRHGGIVQLEEVTVHTGLDMALHIGEGNPGRIRQPGFLFRQYGTRVVADPPPPGQRRAKWLGFYYGADLHFRDVVFVGFEAREHDDYLHSTARWGALAERVDFESAGAECWKIRTVANECAWAGRDAWITLRACKARNFHQVHSDRGGGFFVGQGTSANLMVEDSIVWGGADLPGIPGHLRAKLFMVTSEGNSFDALTGLVPDPELGDPGTGFGNGWVILRRNAMAARVAAPSWWSDMIRVGHEAGGQKPARGLLIEGNGLWGERYSADIQDVPRYIVRGNNTPEIRRRCENLGMNTAHEVSILTAARPIPLSEGASKG